MLLFTPTSLPLSSADIILPHHLRIVSMFLCNRETALLPLKRDCGLPRIIVCTLDECQSSVTSRLICWWLVELPTGLLFSFTFVGSVAISNTNFAFVPPFQSSAHSFFHVSQSFTVSSVSKSGRLKSKQKTNRGKCCKQVLFLQTTRPFVFATNFFRHL